MEGQTRGRGKGRVGEGAEGGRGVEGKGGKQDFRVFPQFQIYHYTTEHTHAQQQQQQPFYGPLSGTTPVSRYQTKHSPTHHPDHPVFISFFHLPRSIASSLFKLRAWQSFCTTSVHVLLCPLWSTSWSGALHLIFHTFLHPFIVFFLQHMPIPSQPVLLYNQYYVIYS